VLLCIAIQRYKLVKKFESWLQGVDLKGPQAREDGFREFGCRFPVSNVFHAVRRDLLTAFVSSSLGLPFSIDWKGIQLHSASSLEGILIEQTHQENREVKPMEGGTPKARIRNSWGSFGWLSNLEGSTI
jgi:hypothetical protein